MTINTDRYPSTREHIGTLYNQGLRNRHQMNAAMESIVAEKICNDINTDYVDLFATISIHKSFLTMLRNEKCATDFRQVFIDFLIQRYAHLIDEVFDELEAKAESERPKPKNLIMATIGQ